MYTQRKINCRYKPQILLAHSQSHNYSALFDQSLILLTSIENQVLVEEYLCLKKADFSVYGEKKPSVKVYSFTWMSKCIHSLGCYR